MKLVKTLLIVLAVLALALPAAAADKATNLKEAFTKGKVRGEFRFYTFQRDFDKTTTDRQDIAAGGSLHYETAPLYGINVGFTFYTSQGMGLNDDDKAVYGLLASDNGNHQSYSVLGESYIQGTFGGTTIKIGRQEMRTLFVNVHDIRLTPQTFMAYQVQNTSLPGTTFTLAYVTQVKRRTSTSFETMSDFTGASKDSEVLTGGVVYKGIKGLKLQLWDAYANDIMNAVFFQADYSFKVAKDFGLFFSGQYLNEKDKGDKLAGKIDTDMFGLKAGFKTMGFTFYLAYNSVGDGSAALYPWGGCPQYSSIQIFDGNRADEKTVLGKLAYDFGRLGIKGLSAYVLHAQYDTPDSGVNASPDRKETDFNLQYNFSGALKGLSIRARMAIVDQDEALGGEDFNDYRLYIKYAFNLL